MSTLIGYTVLALLAGIAGFASTLKDIARLAEQVARQAPELELEPKPLRVVPFTRTNRIYCPTVGTDPVRPSGQGKGVRCL